MKICSYNHSEICFDEYNCPLCDIILEKDKQIEDLEKDNSNLKDEIYLLNEESNLKAKEL